MNTFKRLLAVFLSALLVLSLATVTGITALATDEVTVTVTSKQDMFSDISKTYNKGDVFEFAVLWSSNDLLRGGQFYTHLNSAGLRIIDQETSPLLKSTYSNIKEELQLTDGCVAANFAENPGVNFNTKSHLIKYKVRVLETASPAETLTFDIEDIYGNTTEATTIFIDYVIDSTVCQETLDQYTIEATLGEAIPTPTESTSPSDSVPSSSSNPTGSSDSSDSSDSTAPSGSDSPSSSDSSSDTNSTDPTETGSNSSSDPTSTDPTESSSDTTPSSDTNPTEPSSETTPSSDTAPTDPTETEPTEPSTAKPTPKKPAFNVAKKTLKAGQKYTLKVANADGKKASKWTSSKTKVATVSSKGVVTALGKGKTTISATVGGTKIKCTITVSSSPKIYNGKKAVKNNKTIKVKKGKTLKLTIKGKASGVNNKYKTSNKKLAKVTSKKSATKIKIKAYKKGIAKITITVNKKYKTTIKVKVV